MFDSYTSGGVSVPIKSMNDLVKVVRVLDTLRYVGKSDWYLYEPIDVSYEQEAAINDKVDHDADSAILVMKLLKECDYIQQLDYVIREKEKDVYIYDNMNFYPEYAGKLAMGLLELLDYDELAIVNWANTDDCAVPLEHGGGGSVVSRYGELFMTDHLWTGALAKNLMEQAGLLHSMDWVDELLYEEKCLVCAGTELQADDVLFMHNSAVHKIECLQCGSSWYDIYALVSKQMIVMGKEK